MYIKSVEAISRGQEEDPVESWNEFLFEERIFTKNYRFLMFLNVDYFSGHADEILEHVKYQFDKKRSELKNEKKNQR